MVLVIYIYISYISYMYTWYIHIYIHSYKYMRDSMNGFILQHDNNTSNHNLIIIKRVKNSVRNGLFYCNCEPVRYRQYYNPFPLFMLNLQNLITRFCCWRHHTLEKPLFYSGFPHYSVRKLIITLTKLKPLNYCNNYPG